MYSKSLDIQLVIGIPLYFLDYWWQGEVLQYAIIYYMEKMSWSDIYSICIGFYIFNFDTKNGELYLAVREIEVFCSFSLALKICACDLKVMSSNSVHINHNLITCPGFLVVLIINVC